MRPEGHRLEVVREVLQDLLEPLRLAQEVRGEHVREDAQRFALLMIAEKPGEAPLFCGAGAARELAEGLSPPELSRLKRGGPRRGMARHGL